MARVGRSFAAKACGFGIEIRYYIRTRLSPEQEQGAVHHPTVESLLPKADLLSLRCPATPETRGLMNPARLALLPRGALVEEGALPDAIRSGQLMAAGLGCFQVEPGGNPAFADHPNIFMLPQVGSATRATRDALI